MKMRDRKRRVADIVRDWPRLAYIVMPRVGSFYMVRRYDRRDIVSGGPERYTSNRLSQFTGRVVL